MSKRRLVAPCLVLALAALGAPSAQAQITPAPNTFTLTGPVVFTKASGPPTSCTVTMTFNILPGGMNGAVSMVSFAGSPICSQMAASALPWVVTRITPASLPRFAITNVKIIERWGFCDSGTIYVSWVNAPHNMGHAITQGVMPGNFNGAPYPIGSCKLDGDLYLTSGGPINVQ